MFVSGRERHEIGEDSVAAARFVHLHVHTQYSLLIAVDPESGAPQEAWHIPYSNDPRGVAYAEGIAYVVDGMGPFVDPDTGAGLAPGIRILLFALQAPTKLRLSDLPHRQLPVE